MAVTSPPAATARMTGAPAAEPRERILAAGTRLVAERGLDAINTNVIARAAGVGVGTFYSQFEDKHAFHRAVVSRGLELVRAALADAHERVRERPIPEQVRAVVTAIVDVAAAEPDLFRAAFARGASARRAGGALGLSPRPVEQRLRALQQAGALDPGVDPALAARAFTEMQLALVCWWLDEPARPSRDALIDTLARLHPAVACARGAASPPG